MRNESTDLLTPTQAAEAAGISLQAFRVYVASGNVAFQRIDGKGQMFTREAAERVGALHREAVEDARRSSLELLSAELATMRDAMANQAQMAEVISALEEARRDQGGRLDSLAESLDALRRSMEELESSAEKERRQLVEPQAKRVAELERRMEGLAEDLAGAGKKLGNLGDVAAQALHTANMSASVLDEQKRLAQNQDKLMAELRSGQAESQERIRKLVNSLADAFGQARPNGDPKEPAIAPKKQGSSHPSEEAPAAVHREKAKVDSPEPAKLPEPTQKRISETPVATPAKVGIVREIEFNYLLERMGYRRLDAYDSAEIAASDGLQVPDDDTIKEFLSKYELGCDVAEVEITPVTRGNWQMIQYQRGAKGPGKRGWMGPKR